jgi:nitrate reductase delta subunit
MLTAGDEEPVARGLERMLAMRAYMRAKTVDGVIDGAIARRVGLEPRQIEDLYHVMAIANYEDRFVIPPAHRETSEDAYRLRALAALLSYPTAGLVEALDEIDDVLRREGIVPDVERTRLDRLIFELRTGDLYDLQERYGLLFDRTRALSLHLFEHVHGESRDRGQAMVDLLKLYEEGGYTPIASELPDYLPLFLEYASTRAPREAIALIGQPANVIAALGERLAKRQSAYGAVTAALLAIAKAKLDDATLAVLRAEPDPQPDDLEALDAAWVDQEVTFGPRASDGGCAVDGLADRLRAAMRPADGTVAPLTRGRAAARQGVSP